MSIVCLCLTLTNNKDEMIFKRCEHESDRDLCFILHFHIFFHTDKSNNFVFSLRRYRITRTNSRDVKERKVISLELKNQLRGENYKSE